MIFNYTVFVNGSLSIDCKLCKANIIFFNLELSLEISSIRTLLRDNAYPHSENEQKQSLLPLTFNEKILHLSIFFITFFYNIIYFRYITIQ